MWTGPTLTTSVHECNGDVSIAMVGRGLVRRLFYCKNPFHPAAEPGGTVAFGGYGNVYSWTLPQVGQMTLVFSSICSLFWSAIPSRKAVNAGPQSLQRSSVFSSAIVVLSE